MEFTYEGIVRWGFGFFNPNHAAAFFCAILPFSASLAVSGKAAQKIFGVCLSGAILAAVALTYSRAGILVASLEILAMAFWGKKRNAAVFAAIALLFVAAIFATSAASRIACDAAMSNRLLIWRAGLALFAKNPLGVGFGNSGEIVSAFMLPDGISCRTLVNSHLTFACEFGVFAFAACLAAIFYALICGAKKSGNSVWAFAAFVAFSGFLVSAALSTVFDFEVLFYPERFDWLSKMNVFCQWLNFLLFAGLGAFLIFGGFCKKAFAFSASAAAAFALCACIFAPKADVKIMHGGGEVFAGSSNPSSAAFFGDEYSLKSAVKILKKLDLLDGAAVCVNSVQNAESLPMPAAAKTAVLFGHAAEFINQKSGGDCEYILISPPPHISFAAKPPKAIFLPKSSRGYANLRAVFENVRDF